MICVLPTYIFVEYIFIGTLFQMWTRETVREYRANVHWMGVWINWILHAHRHIHTHYTLFLTCSTPHFLHLMRSMRGTKCGGVCVFSRRWSWHFTQGYHVLQHRTNTSVWMMLFEYVFRVFCFILFILLYVFIFKILVFLFFFFFWGYNFEYLGFGLFIVCIFCF